MPARIRSLVALLVLLALAPAPPAAATDGPSRSNLTPAQERVVDWALALYDEAGLRLPPVDFVAHATVDGCHGFRGYHDVEGGRSTVHLCGSQRRRFAEVLTLHELAHAWDRANLTGARRADFLRLRNLDAWRNDSDAWDELGAEHAAEILAWGLRDRPMQVIQIPDAGCDELLEGYVMLVGRPPLHGFTDLCER